MLWICAAAPVESEMVEQLLTAFKKKTPEKDLVTLLDTLVLQNFPELFNNREGVASFYHNLLGRDVLYSFSGKES